MADETQINAGDLRFRLQIQANTPTNGPKGTRVDSWATVATRWGNIMPASGKSFVASEQIRNATTHKIVMRYYDGLTPRHRIIYNGRVFHILQTLNENERNIRHTVLATEVI